MMRMSLEVSGRTNFSPSSNCTWNSCAVLTDSCRSAVRSNFQRWLSFWSWNWTRKAIQILKYEVPVFTSIVWISNFNCLMILLGFLLRVHQDLSSNWCCLIVRIAVCDTCYLQRRWTSTIQVKTILSNESSPRQFYLVLFKETGSFFFPTYFLVKLTITITWPMRYKKSEVFRTWK